MSKLQDGPNEYNYAAVKKWFPNVDIFALNKLFIPCNEVDHHWSLVVVDFIKKRIRNLDSLNPEDEKGKIYRRNMANRFVTATWNYILDE